MAKKLFFFYDTATKYLISFMSIWKNIYIQTVIDGKSAVYNIPVVYGQYSKYSEIRRFIKEKGENFLSGYYNTPIISIREDGIEFDTERDPFNKNNVNIHHSNASNTNLKNRIPVPITYKFQMKIWVTYLNHQSQIYEQIVPYIMRPFSLKLLEFPDVPDIKRSVVCTVPSKGISYSYDEESDPENSTLKMRVMTIDFEIKGQMYYPVSNDEGFIKKIKVQFEDGNTGDDFGTQVVEGVDEYIDYLELIKIKEIKENGGFTTENSEGATILNQYIRADDYLYNNVEYKDILDMVNNTTVTNGDTDE